MFRPSSTLSLGEASVPSCYQAYCLYLVHSMVQLFVHKPSHAIGPKEAEHTNAGGFWASLCHGFQPFRRGGDRRVVQVQAHQVDRRDDDLHGTRCGKLRNLVSRLLLHAIRLEPTCNHCWQNEACPNDERIPKQESSVSRHGNCALNFRSTCCCLAKHLREGNVLNDGGTRVGSCRTEKLQRVLCSGPQLVALAKNISKVVGTIS